MFPPAFNNLVGFKPTRGSWSTGGLVPACRTLDCITVLTKTLDEAERDRHMSSEISIRTILIRAGRWTSAPPALRRIGVLPNDEREFFGDDEYARLYAEAVERPLRLGWSVSEFDYRPFREAANLLYSGPWVAERYSAAKFVLSKQTRMPSIPWFALSS